MGKAKTIDRLELTRRKFTNFQNEAQQVVHSEAQEVNNEHFGLSTCPFCKKLTLVHEGGCAHCTNCGWSACG